MNIRFELVTTLLGTELIKQGLVDTNRTVVSSWVIDTREKQLKEALIYLGWTPPTEVVKSPIGRLIRHKSDVNKVYGVYKISDCGYNTEHPNNESWMVHIKDAGIDRHLILLKSDYEFCD